MPAFTKLRDYQSWLCTHKEPGSGYVLNVQSIDNGRLYRKGRVDGWKLHLSTCDHVNRMDSINRHWIKIGEKNLSDIYSWAQKHCDVDVKPSSIGWCRCISNHPPSLHWRSSHDLSTWPRLIRTTSSIAEDLESLRQNTDISSTTRSQLIEARIGQGEFREQVLALWGHRCAVTGCSVLETLRASHIKPWRDATDEERLDPDNGLPLVATMDALFDAGLISFSDTGEMLVSSRVSKHDRNVLGIPLPLKYERLSTKSLVYLHHHRSQFGFPN